MYEVLFIPLDTRKIIKNISFLQMKRYTYLAKCKKEIAFLFGTFFLRDIGALYNPVLGDRKSGNRKP
jgi:orotidine-5'-phosphate decarboxylase